MYQIYPVDTLKVKKLDELKAIAAQLGAVAQDKRSKQSWIDAIIAKQPEKVESVNNEAIAPVVIQELKTCANCPHFNSHGDGTDKGWCCLFDRFARETHATTQDCINSMEEVEQEQVDDYLFHNDPTPMEQPTSLPTVGETYHTGDFVLVCKEVAGECAAVWEVRQGKQTLGDIRMGWDTFWTHTMSLATFTTPQEATVNLYESLVDYGQELTDMRKKARELQVGDRLSLRPSASLGHALDAPAQDVEIAKTKKQSNSGGCRVTVWVVGQDRPYAYLRGSCVLTVEHRVN